MARKKGVSLKIARVQNQTRRYEFIELVKAGIDQREISARFGVSQPTVSREITRGLEELAKKYKGSADAIRALNNERLTALLSKWYPLALAADQKAAELCLRIINDLNRLNGCLPDRPMITIQNQNILETQDIVFQIDAGETVAPDAIPTAAQIVD